MKKITDKDFKYVPSEKMGPDYLKKKFKQLERAQRAKNKAEQRPAAPAITLKRRTA